MDTLQNLASTRLSKGNSQKAFGGRTEVLITGLILAIVGAMVGGTFEKGTLTNYMGFGMLLVGIAVFVVGICSVFTTNIEARTRRENPDFFRGKKRLPIYNSIWAIGAGLILAVLGSMLASVFDRALLINTVGFGMLLTGIGVSVLGLSSVALETVKIELLRDQPSKVKTPRALLFSIISLGLGFVFLIIGTILAESYAKDTLFNDSGFGMLIAGIAILCLGAAGTAVTLLKARLYRQSEVSNEPQPQIVFGSIWAIGIGIMFLIIGLILTGNFAKNTFMNYTGFGMLLAGAGVFVYGLFETAKASAMGYLNYRSSRKNIHTKRATQPRSRVLQFSFFWKNMVRTSSIFNLAGIIASVCILFFSIWQLDMIVSGPVWWSSEEQGMGYGWSHPNGAYANDYFQCFMWKTTIGQAYDTLFMLIFISFIVMFLSAYFWPKKDRISALKQNKQEETEPVKDPQYTQETTPTQPKETTPETEQPAVATTIYEEIKVHTDY
ncbi:MAG: hypothetical protein LBQ98_03885 [Nitrososphaerota archaeon]|jgi:hypothetical protein|nr:hypothetical protein [Nitrososphaerota archaeon]